MATSSTLAETLHVERLHDVVERPTRQRLAGETFISVGRHHDNRDVRAQET